MKPSAGHDGHARKKLLKIVFWRRVQMTGPTPHPFRTAFICAAVAFVIPMVSLSVAWGPTGDQGSRLFGFLVALTALPALITGYLARRAKMAWSGMKIAVVYVIVLFAIALLYIIGKLPPHQ
jgi:hypothetical protein